MAAEQDRHAVASELRQHRPDLAGAGGIETAGGLVEQQQSGRPQQRRGDPEALAHPGRVPAHPVAGPGGQPDLFEKLVEPSGAGGGVGGGVGGGGGSGVAPIELGQQLEVRPPRQVRVEGRVLNEAGHAIERHLIVPVDWAVQELDPASVRPHQPEEHPQERGLAGAIGTEKAAQLALGKLEVDAIHRARRAKPLHQAADTDCRHPAHYKQAI